METHSRPHFPRSRHPSATPPLGAAGMCLVACLCFARFLLFWAALPVSVLALLDPVRAVAPSAAPLPGTPRALVR